MTDRSIKHVQELIEACLIQGTDFSEDTARVVADSRLAGYHPETLHSPADVLFSSLHTELTRENKSQSGVKMHLDAKVTPCTYVQLSLTEPTNQSTQNVRNNTLSERNCINIHQILHIIYSCVVYFAKCNITYNNVQRLYTDSYFALM